VSASLEEAGKNHFENGSFARLCGNLLQTMATSSATFQDLLSERMDLIAHFTDKCEAVSEKQHSEKNHVDHENQSSEASSTNATTTAPLAPVTATTTASSTTTTTTSIEVRIRDYLKHYFPAQDSERSHEKRREKNGEKGKEGAIIQNQLDFSVGDE
jgi:hypothetical protein